MNKSVSVILPFHRVNKFLREAIESIHQEELVTCQITLVNDTGASIDSKLLPIRPGDQLINSSSRGYQPTMTTGVENVTTDYVAFMDSDDLSEPNRISESISAIDSKDADLCTCEMKKFRTRTRKFNLSLLGPTPRASTPRALLLHTFHGADSTLVIKRELLIRSWDRFAQTSAKFADYSLVAGMGEDVKFARVNRPLYNYRMNLVQMSRVDSNDISSAELEQFYSSWQNNLKVLAKDHPKLQRHLNLSATAVYDLFSLRTVKDASDRRALRSFLSDLEELSVTENLWETFRWRVNTVSRKFICTRLLRAKDLPYFLFWSLWVALAISTGSRPRR